MITIEQEALVTADHLLTLRVPASVPPGRRRVVAILEDEQATDETKLGLEDFPQFPEAVSPQQPLSRDVIYDERGR